MNFQDNIYEDFEFEVNIYPPGISAEKIAAYEANQIVDFDMRTYNYLAVIAGLLQRAKNKGVNIDIELSKAQNIFNKVSQRQKELAQTNMFKISYSEHDNQLKSFANNVSNQNYLGAVVTIFGVAIAVKYIIAAVIVATAVITTATIYYLQNRTTDAQNEFNQSKKVIRDILDKLDEKDRETLVAEINSQLNAAYRRGKIRQWWAIYGSLLRTGAYIVGGFLLAVYVLPKAIKAVKNTKQIAK